MDECARNTNADATIDTTRKKKKIEHKVKVCLVGSGSCGFFLSQPQANNRSRVIFLRRRQRCINFGNPKFHFTIRTMYQYLHTQGINLRLTTRKKVNGHEQTSNKSTDRQLVMKCLANSVLKLYLLVFDV